MEKQDQNEDRALDQSLQVISKLSWSDGGFVVSQESIRQLARDLGMIPEHDDTPGKEEIGDD